MRVDEFLDALYETPRAWYLTDKGEIRILTNTESRASADDPIGGHCPWSIMPGYVEITHGDEDVQHAVWDAADNVRGHDPRIRAALLAACGLPDEAAS